MTNIMTTMIVINRFMISINLYACLLYLNVMEECSCGRDKGVVDFVKISATRTIIQCVNCGGVVAFIDNEPEHRNYPIGQARKWSPWLLEKLK